MPIDWNPKKGGFGAYKRTQLCCDTFLVVLIFPQAWGEEEVMYICVCISLRHSDGFVSSQLLR